MELIIINDVGEYNRPWSFHAIANEAFNPDTHWAAICGFECGADRDVDHECGEERGQIVEDCVEFCLTRYEFGGATTDWKEHPCDRMKIVFSSGLFFAKELGEVVEIKVVVDDRNDVDLVYPGPTFEVISGGGVHTGWVLAIMDGCNGLLNRCDSLLSSWGGIGGLGSRWGVVGGV